MHFLPPVYVTCEACNGRRYNRETLEITYKGMNIADVLDMTVDEAVTFFRAVPQIYDPLLTLAEVGLGYIRLGPIGHDVERRRGAARQTGRGTEPQRRPAARFTFWTSRRPACISTTWPNCSKCFSSCAPPATRLLVIEHNLDVIKTADWIIDLGPEGGDAGGQIVAEGQAQARFKLKLYTGVVDLLSANLSRAGPWADQYHFWLAQAWFESGNYQDAATAFAKVVNEFPASTNRLEASIGEAAARLNLKDWSGVIERLRQTNGVFQQSAKLKPDNEYVVRGYLLLGGALLAQKDFQAAEETVQLLAKKKLSPALDWRRQFLLCRIQLAAGRTEARRVAGHDESRRGSQRPAGQPELQAQSVAFHAGILERLEPVGGGGGGLRKKSFAGSARGTAPAGLVESRRIISGTEQGRRHDWQTGKVFKPISKRCRSGPGAADARRTSPQGICGFAGGM